MANAQLIQMAKEIGKSKGFVDVGAEFEASFGKWVGKAEEALKARRDKRDEGIAKITSYMEKMPSHAQLPKVPAYAQEQVGGWLKDQRAEYAVSARALKDLDPQSDKYLANVNNMNRITQSVSRLNDQFSTLLEDKTNYMDAVNEGVISNATKPEDVNELADVYTDASKLSIGADGQLSFNGKSFDDLPKWQAQNSEIPMALTQLNAQYYKNAQVIDGPLAENLKVQVEQIIKGAGRSGVMSLAADSDLGLDEDLITNPERYDELVKTMITTWTEAIKGSAKIGKEQADAEWKMKHPKKETPSKYGLDKYFLELMNNVDNKTN